MKLIIDISDEAYSMVMNTVFTEDSEIMFKQNAEGRRKTLQLFATLDAIKSGKPYLDGNEIRQVFCDIPPKNKEVEGRL